MNTPNNSIAIDMSSYRLTLPPKHVGYWILPGSEESFKFKIACPKKPNWLSRVSMKYIFGWTWEDDNA